MFGDNLRLSFCCGQTKPSYPEPADQLLFSADMYHCRSPCSFLYLLLTTSCEFPKRSFSIHRNATSAEESGVEIVGIHSGNHHSSPSRRCVNHEVVTDIDPHVRGEVCICMEKKKVALLQFFERHIFPQRRLLSRRSRQRQILRCKYFFHKSGAIDARIAASAETVLYSKEAESLLQKSVVLG